VWNGGKIIRDATGIDWLVVWTGPLDGMVIVTTEDE